MTGDAGGVTALFGTLGFTLGPVVGALSWSLAGGGVAAFRTGTVVLAAACAAALALTVTVRATAGTRVDAAHALR
jgi:hypothetical protein